MAKKRSKKDKLKALARQRNKKQSLPAKKIQSEPAKTKNLNQQKLFSYDPKLIWQDLAKTLVVTIIVLVVLALIALRYT